MKPTEFRTVRFHLSGTTAEVVIPHPSAEGESALQQGYIVMRFEPATSLEFRQAAVDLLNKGNIKANQVWLPEFATQPRGTIAMSNQESQS